MASDHLCGSFLIGWLEALINEMRFKNHRGHIITHRHTQKKGALAARPFSFPIIQAHVVEDPVPDEPFGHEGGNGVFLGDPGAF
ncbi:jg6332 [Pararge aegeria aegeria]|uniref:Jg6332 protein n=1 Tax=Pararge aegeria aegeria TaxID=348720 RepID=A0A8S4RR29_9NEOP|nr:jg6332 [Pararge aegeria aegeria]